MGVVSKGIQITRAVKSAGRLRQILGVFSRQGFGDVIERMRLGAYLPNRLLRWSDADQKKNFGERLRESFEQLGPTFVKLGQILSMRPDLVPESVIVELVKLQDRVQPISYDVVKGIVESELKKPIDLIFASFEREPLASASIGQVHCARLLTGEEVVVKIQRPGIRKLIETDIVLLEFLAETMEKYFPELRVLNPRVFVEEFFKTLQQELDYKIEANNISKTSKNLSELEGIILPHVYKEFTTQQILVLERFHGIRLNDRDAIERAGVDRKRIAVLGAKAFLYSVMKYGLFHGDLHGGNLFILPPRAEDGGHCLGVIDFGIVGRLSRRSRDQLAVMMQAIIQEDYETLCYTYAELGGSDTSIDFDSFQREVRNTLSPYLGLNLSEVNSGRVLIEATKVAAKYNIRVPGDWMLVFKAIVTLEGMGRGLDPEFDILTLGEELVKDIVKIQYSPQRITTETLGVGREMLALLQVLPRSIRWGLRRLAKNDYALEIISPDLQKISRSIDSSGRRNARAIAGMGLLISGSIIIHSGAGEKWNEYPILGLVLLGFGVFMLLRRR